MLGLGTLGAGLGGNRCRRVEGTTRAFVWTEMATVTETECYLEMGTVSVFDEGPACDVVAGLIQRRAQ